LAAGYSFEDLEGPHLLNRKKLVSPAALDEKKVA
jgi:hypothetical protein